MHGPQPLEFVREEIREVVLLLDEETDRLGARQPSRVEPLDRQRHEQRPRRTREIHS